MQRATVASGRRRAFGLPAASWVAALTLLACTRVTSGSVALEPTQAGRIPLAAAPAGDCDGEGFDGVAVLHGAADQRPAAWADVGGRRFRVFWPAGYAAVFDPGLRVVAGDRTIADAGDVITEGGLGDNGVCISGETIVVTRPRAADRPASSIVGEAAEPATATAGGLTADDETEAVRSIVAKARAALHTAVVSLDGYERTRNVDLVLAAIEEVESQVIEQVMRWQAVLDATTCRDLGERIHAAVRRASEGTAMLRDAIERRDSGRYGNGRAHLDAALVALDVVDARLTKGRRCGR